jgi:N-acetyl-anhydromuramyl-L-alanine amidase AmpD
MEGRHGSLAAAKTGKVVRGAHAGVDHFNRKWFGIELEGDFRETFALTEQQWQTLIELCAWLSSLGEFDAQKIEGHKEVKGDVDGGTDCPGLLSDHLVELREAVQGRKALS